MVEPSRQTSDRAWAFAGGESVPEHRHPRPFATLRVTAYEVTLKSSRRSICGGARYVGETKTARTRRCGIVIASNAPEQSDPAGGVGQHQHPAVSPPWRMGISPARPVSPSAAEGPRSLFRKKRRVVTPITRFLRGVYLEQRRKVLPRKDASRNDRVRRGLRTMPTRSVLD